MRQVVLLLLLGVSACYGFIACSPDLCKMICKNPITAQGCAAEGKEYREKASMCGCCARCIDYLKEGETCSMPMPQDPLLEAGAPQRVMMHCKPPCSCIDNKCKCNRSD